MTTELIDFFKNFNPPSSKEMCYKNIFDVGLKKMYENPFTEILSFMLSANNPCKHRNEFLKYFITGLTGDENIANSFLENINIETQVITRNGNYIDMIIYNNLFIITLENKIGHIPVNPFKDYEEEIKQKYYSHEKIFFIFSADECSDYGKWKNIVIKDVFSFILGNIKFQYSDKWSYFTKDFLEHYIEEEITMTKEEFNLCEQYFSKFILGEELLQKFVKGIILEIKSRFNTKNVTQQSSWKARRTEGQQSCEGGIGIRIRPFEKKDLPDIVLILNQHNLYSIGIYYTDETGKKIDEISKIVGTKYMQWVERKDKVICYYLMKDYHFSGIEEAYKEIEIQLDRMKKVYKL